MLLRRKFSNFEWMKGVLERLKRGIYNERFNHKSCSLIGGIHVIRTSCVLKYEHCWRFPSWKWFFWPVSSMQEKHGKLLDIFMFIGSSQISYKVKICWIFKALFSRALSCIIITQERERGLWLIITPCSCSSSRALLRNAIKLYSVINWLSLNCSRDVK